MQLVNIKKNIVVGVVGEAVSDVLEAMLAARPWSSSRSGPKWLELVGAMLVNIAKPNGTV